MVEEARRPSGASTAGLIEAGQVVMIDGGSTTYEVARGLAQLTRDLVVITNSTGIAAVAGGNPTFRVILCPGTYDRREGSVLGEDTVEFVRRYNADVAIIGASGVSFDGPSDTISGAASVKRAMIGPRHVDDPGRDQQQVRGARAWNACARSKTSRMW